MTEHLATTTDQLAEMLMNQLMSQVADMKLEAPETMQNTLSEIWNERFDQNKLKYIIDHLEQYKTKIISVGHDFKENDEKWKQQHKQLTRYLEASKNGVLSVKYSGVRPHVANRSMSLQGITRAVRHTIAAEFYWDIDIENAHRISWSSCASSG